MSLKNYTQFLRESALIEMMRLDQESGLYDTDFSITELNFSPRGFVGDFDKVVLDMKSVLANFFVNLKNSQRDIQRDFAQLYSSFNKTGRKLSQMEYEKIIDVLEPIITRSGFKTKLKNKDLSLCFLSAMSQTKNLDSKIPSEVLESLSNDQLFEGGAYGHISHPFEDFGLTMQDLRDMINTTVNGSFGPDNFVQEKTDGQNILISWKNGKLIAARNGSHLKNAGENALDSAGIANQYVGRGDIETAYNAAMADLSAAISSLSDDDKKKYFEEGKKFASVEVITPITQNTVPYGKDMLVLHGVIEHDEAGKAIGEDKQAGRDLGKLIADANAAAQKKFYVRGPQDIAAIPFPNTKSRASYYDKKLGDVMKDSNSTLSSTVGDYALGMGKRILLEEASKAKVEIPAEYLDGLARRIADIDKSYTVPNIKKDLGDAGNWFLDLEKSRAKELKRKVFAPIESLFLEIGTEMMKNISAFLSANPTEASQAMRKEIDATIAKVRTNGDETDVSKLEHELTRVTAAGGLESIVPTEGITFIFKGNLYKYTGIFAPLHQIRSILAYKK